MTKTTTAASQKTQQTNETEVIRAKCELLASHPDLLKLHKELVGRGILKEEDFWSTRQDLLDTQVAMCKQVAAPAIVAPPTSTPLWSQTGSSSASKKGVTIAPNGVEAKVTEKSITYTVTPGIIASIYKSSPEVRQAHEDLVETAGKVTEREFWVAYFNSLFFDPRLPPDPKNLLHKYYKKKTDSDDANHTAMDVDEVNGEENNLFSDQEEDDYIEYSRPLAGKNEATQELIQKYNTYSLETVKKGLGGSLKNWAAYEALFNVKKDAHQQENINIDSEAEQTIVEATEPVAQLQIFQEFEEANEAQSYDRIPEGKTKFTWEEYKRYFPASINKTTFSDAWPEVPGKTVEVLKFHHRKCVEVLQHFWQCSLKTAEGKTTAKALCSLMDELWRQVIEEWDVKEVTRLFEPLRNSFSIAQKRLVEAEGIKKSHAS